MGVDPVGTDFGRGQPLADPGPLAEVGHKHLEQIIEVAADVRGLDDLGDRRDRFVEPRQIKRAVRLQPDLGEQDEAGVEPERIEAGMIALDDPRLLEPADPRQAGAGRERDPLGEGLVGQPAVGLEIGQNLPVDPVEAISCAHRAIEPQNLRPRSRPSNAPAARFELYNP